MPLDRTPVGQATGPQGGEGANWDGSSNQSQIPNLSAAAPPFEMPRQQGQPAGQAQQYEFPREPATGPTNNAQFPQANDRYQQLHGQPDAVNFDQSWRNVVRGQIIKMNPVELETDELHYELGLRALSNAGHHRDRTARLGNAIVNERRNPNLYPRESHWPWPKDEKVCKAKINHLAKLLGHARLLPSELARIATLLAHVEGRVGRMRPPSTNDAVVQREMLSLTEDYVQTFLNRLEEMARTQGTIPKPHKAMNTPNVEANEQASAAHQEPFEIYEDDRDQARAMPDQASSANITMGGDASPGPLDSMTAWPTFPPGGSRCDGMSFLQGFGAANYQPDGTYVAAPGDMSQFTIDTHTPHVSVDSRDSNSLGHFDSGRTGAPNGINERQQQDGRQQKNVRFSENRMPERNQGVNHGRHDTPHPASGRKPQFYDENEGFRNPFERSSGFSDHSVPSSMFSGYSKLSDLMSSIRGAHSTRIEDDREHRHERFANDDRYGTGTQRQPPVNETYTVNSNATRNAPEGQWIFIPFVSTARSDETPEFEAPGEYVFLPFDEPNAWKVILDALEARREEERQVLAERRANARPAPAEAAPVRVDPTPVMRTTPWTQSAPTYHPRLKTVPVHLWKISFSGDRNSREPTDLRVNEFLYQVEINKRAQRITDEEMLGQVVWLLNGPARTWYYAYFRNFTSWNVFITLIRRRFLPPYYEQDAIDEISKRVQKKGEDPLAYMNHMVMLFQTVPGIVEEARLVRIIRRNLDRETQKHVGPEVGIRIVDIADE